MPTPSFLQGCARAVQSYFLTPEEKAAQEEASRKIALFKLVAVVTAVVASLVFAAHSTLFVSFVTLPVVYLSYELFTVLNNIDEIRKDPLLEASCLSRENLYKQLCKSAPITRLLLDIFRPDQAILQLTKTIIKIKL